MSDTMFNALMSLALVCAVIAIRFVWLGLCSHFRHSAEVKTQRSLDEQTDLALEDVVRQFGA